MPLKEVDWSKFEFRAHYFGELMTPVRGKSNKQLYEEALARYNKKYDEVSKMKEGLKGTEKHVAIALNMSERVDELEKIKDIPVLSETCIRRLNQIYTEETTGRKKKIQSIAIEKGLMTEEDSITTYSLKFGAMYRKNKRRLSNGYVTGEIDFEDDELDMVVDTKSSYDIFTFDETVASAINGMKRVYEWQGHIYMWLFERSRFRLAYCLNDTPEELIQRLEKAMRYQFLGSEEDFKEACNELRKNHIFSDLPLDRKIRIYDLNRDENKIEQAKEMIPHFRKYLENYGQQRLDDYEEAV